MLITVFQVMCELYQPSVEGSSLLFCTESDFPQCLDWWSLTMALHCALFTLLVYHKFVASDLAIAIASILIHHNDYDQTSNERGTVYPLFIH